MFHSCTNLLYAKTCSKGKPIQKVNYVDLELAATIWNLNINFSFIIIIQKETIGVIIWADFTVRIAFCSWYWWTLLAWPDKRFIISFEQNKSISMCSGYFVLRLSEVFVLLKKVSSVNRALPCQGIFFHKYCVSCLKTVK